MAIDTRQKRQAAATFGHPWSPSVLPTGVSTALERAASANGYILLSQTISLSPITWTGAIANPTLIQAGSSGSTLPFTYFIGGVDRSGYVGTETAPQITGQVNSKYTATFKTIDISGSVWTPTEGDEVKIYEGTTLIFNGWITRTVEERLIGTVSRVAVTCGDAGVKLAQRAVNAFYPQDLYGSAYFIVPDLIAKHASDLGITYVRDPADNDLALIGDQLFYCLPFTECMNQLAKAMDADWIVTPDRNLKFIFASSATVNSNAFTDSSGNWLEVQATRTISLEGNRIYAKSSAQLLQTQTDTFTGDPVGIYTMTYPPRDQSLVPIVKENGTAKTVVTLLDAIAGATYDYFRNGTIVQKNLSATPLTSGDTVTVTYPSPVPYVAIAEDSADIATNGLKEVILECGNITSKTTLQEIADSWLARLKQRATQLNIRTSGNVGGTALATSARNWQPGELVSVNLTSASGTVTITDDFLVDSFTMQITENTVRLQTLVLSNVQYQRTANPAKFLQDLIARLRTQVPLATQVLTLTQDTDLGTGFVLNVDQQINLDSTNGPFTVTLPDAKELYGKEVTFKKISSDSNPITIQAPTISGTQQVIDLASSQTLTEQMQSLVIAGNQWQ